MTTRRIATLPDRVQEQQLPTWNTGFPLDSFVQIYPRVSSPEQKKNVSAEMQQDKGFALLCGWREEHIIMDTDDLGLSGQLRMEDRPAFVKMLRNIAEGKVKAVIAAQVDRLFRDRWGQEYSKFMEICYTYGVKVITPNPYRNSIEFVYDFSIKGHVDQFRRKCEEAWSYIENHIGRMLAAREELARAGFWACGNLPIGYLVDRREKVDRQKNPLYRKYVPYPRHACVICWLFERFKELAGNANELFQEIQRREYLFPAFDEGVDEELVSRFRLKRVLGADGTIKGYTFASVSGLRSILSNPAYAGYWVYKGVVVKGDNHDAIVDFGTFLYAFNRLSPTNLDGTPNESYLERQGQYVKRHQPERPALLKNHVVAGNEGYTIYTYTFPLQGQNSAGKAEVAYAFYPKTSAPRGSAYMIPVREVDPIFLERFIYRLQNAEGFENFLDHETAEQQARKQLQEDIERDIKAVRSLTGKLLIRLTALTGEDEETPETDEGKDSQDDEEKEAERELVREIKRAYKGHKAELSRLLSRQQEVASSFTQTEVRRTYKQLMQEAGDAWEEVVTPEELPLMIDAFVKKVVLTSLSPRFYKISIHWFDPEWGIDERVVFKGGNPSLHWTKAEDAILTAYYPDSPRAELMRLLPARSYTAMKGRASTIRIRRRVVDKGEVVHTFCLNDLEIMAEYNLTEEQLRQGEGANLLTWSAS